MKKQEALEDLEKRVKATVAWKKIVDKAVYDSDPNTHLFMVVLGNTIGGLHKAFDSLKTEICLGWD